jgi:hypothetical protein
MTKSKRVDETTTPEDTEPELSATGDTGPADDLDVESSITSEPTPVEGPADGVTPVDPSRPVGNWGVYPAPGAGEDAVPARDTEE